MWPRNSFCGILVKTGAPFCPCLRNLPEVKVKRLILIILTRKISEIPIIDFVYWLSLTKSILNKPSKLRKKKHKMCVLIIKRVPKRKIELNPFLRGMGLWGKMLPNYI